MGEPILSRPAYHEGASSLPPRLQQRLEYETITPSVSSGSLEGKPSIHNKYSKQRHVDTSGPIVRHEFCFQHQIVLTTSIVLINGGT